MEQNGTQQTIATFRGTLLCRERHPEKPIVKLTFREKDQNWLCVSSDPKTAKLDVGKDYKIEGVFKQLGEHAYIHEPSISLIKPRALAIKISIITAVILVLGGGAAAALKLMPSSKPANYTTPTPTPESLSSQPTTDTKTNESTTPPPVATVTPQPTPASTSAKTATRQRAAARTNAGVTPPVSSQASATIDTTTQQQPTNNTDTSNQKDVDPNAAAGSVVNNGAEGNTPDSNINPQSAPVINPPAS